jgi:tetratricopeptide (TPR) repeat protein
MRAISQFAVALILAASPAYVFAQDTAAKTEKPKKEKKPKKGEVAPVSDAPKASPEFVKAIDPYNAASKAKDWAKAREAVQAAAAIAKTPYEKFIAGQYLVNVAIGASTDPNSPEIYTGLDQMIDSGYMPPEGMGQRANLSGNQAYRLKNYPKAVQRLTMAAKAGYFGNNTILLLIFAHSDQNQLNEAGAVAREYGPKIAATSPSDAKQIYERVAENYRQADRPAETFEFLRAAVPLGITPEGWRKYLTILMQSGDFERETDLDIRRLMDASGGLADRQDFLSYGIDAVEEGLPSEALAIIDRGVAAGKLKLTATTGQPNLAKETADKARAKIADETSSLAASERDSVTAKTGRTARFTGDVFYSRGDYAKAITLYRMALQKGEATKPDFANIVNTRLGAALYYTGDTAGAQAAFKAITGQRAELARFWLAFIDYKQKPPVTPAAAAVPPAKPKT